MEIARAEVEFNTLRIQEYAKVKGYSFTHAVDDLIAQHKSRKNINEVIDLLVEDKYKLKSFSVFRLTYFG